MIWKNSHLPLAILMDENLVVWLKKGIPLTCDSTWLGLGHDSGSDLTRRMDSLHFRTVEQHAKHGSEQLAKNICGSVSKLTKLHSRILDGWLFVHILPYFSGIFTLLSLNSSSWVAANYKWRLLYVSAQLNQVKQILFSICIGRKWQKMLKFSFNARKRTKALKSSEM